jgi:hypothetical protein
MAEEIEIIVTATGFDKVSSGLKNTNDALKSTANEAKKTGDALKTSLNNGSNQAAQSILNLSRIAQDAPFGFIGIANNINPLVESFGRLKSETGSTGGALKALVGSLTGPAGLGLAFGVVTAAISFAQIGFGAWNRSSKETKETADDTAKALESIISSIAKEATNVTSLVAVLNNENETRDRKLSALNELKKINPQIFGDLDLEKGKVEGLTTAYDTYLSSLKNTLTAKLLQKRIEDELNKLIELQGGALTESEKGIIGMGNAINTGLINNLKQFGDEGANAALGLTEINNAVEKKKQGNIDAVKGKIAALTAELSKLSNSINLPPLDPDRKKKVPKATKALETLADAYKKFREELYANAQLEFFTGESQLKNNISIYKSFIETAVKKFKASGLFVVPLVTELRGLEGQLEPKKVKDLVKSLQEKINLTPIEIPFAIPNGAINNLKKQTVDITDALSKALESSISAIGIGLGEGLAAAITGTANFGNIFQNIFNALGGVVATLGEQIISIGAAALVAQAAIAQALANPFLVIAAGVALVALGSLIKSTTSNQNRFAVGTRNAPGGMALVGERGPDMISLPRGSQVLPAAQTANILGGVGGAVEIYGILRGQDIYFSNKKYSATYARTT